MIELALIIIVVIALLLYVVGLVESFAIRRVPVIVPFIRAGGRIKPRIKKIHRVGRVGRVDRVGRVRPRPTPTRTLSEERVIRAVEELTGAKFPTSYPEWLVSPDGKRLELDGYNESLRIAVEYSGPLHTSWHPNVEPYERYLRRVEMDKYKKLRASEVGIYLIVIDYRLPVHLLRRYLRSRLYDAGFYTEKPADYIPEQLYAPFVE